MYAHFIDGETYEIIEVDGEKFIYGNFIKSFIVNYNTSPRYEDRVIGQGFPVMDVEIRRILKITRPLKFKQIL